MKSSNQQVTNIVDYLFLFPLGTNSETIIHEMPELYLKRKSHIFYSSPGLPFSCLQNIPGHFEDPQNVFQDSVVVQQCLNIQRHQLLTLYIQCDSTMHHETFIKGCIETATFIHTWCSIHKKHIG